MQFHPDCGGTEEAMKQINTEYDSLFEQLKKQTQGSTDSTETAQTFKDIINLLITLSGINIEVCGSWLWIDGDTKPHKDSLKEAGCRWSSGKKKWYWTPTPIKRKSSKMTMEQIYSKYGKTTIKNTDSLVIA